MVESFSSSLIPGLADDVAELCLSRIPRSSFQIISQVCWRWRRFLRSERYETVRKMTGSVEELMCVLVDHQYWEVYDGSGNKLGWIPPVPGPINCSFGHAVLDGRKIMVFGGQSGRAVSADVYEFNPASNKWRKLADMNMPRYNFAYVIVDGLVYVIRGYSSFHASIPNAEVYNPKTNKWSLMDCPHRPNFHGMAFSFNSKLFVVDNESSIIDIYDHKTETWEELDSGQSLSVYSYTIIRNKVYFLNWFRPGMGVFDPEKNSWSSVFVPPTNEGGLRYYLGQWNNKVILFSREHEALSGDLDKEDASKWRATRIRPYGHHSTSVLINI
ncbi:unnamed protein product [Eruca vesicaria subsp. sativa]|uniref:F-box domain-containing protein n=1 Tax=Eruca vesicaria subsp. sativa TaxID=29727 RepID=A0ABC8K2A0_ERUVS|nr:unnamed protein product [Eruca vesicaria subsp. sativa]